MCLISEVNFFLIQYLFEQNCIAMMSIKPLTKIVKFIVPGLVVQDRANMDIWWKCLKYKNILHSFNKYFWEQK